MTQPNIKLSSDEVRRHARVVDETGAGHSLVEQFTGILNPFQDHAIGEMKQAVTATQAIADTLRAMADDFDLTDEAAARRLGGK